MGRNTRATVAAVKFVTRYAVEGKCNLTAAETLINYSLKAGKLEAEDSHRFIR